MADAGSTRLAIVGGGVTGLMTAYHGAPLARLVRVLEKSRAGHPQTASYGLTSRSSAA